ncbi:MAG: hypothetical protein H7A37_00135 [Chlamydiales bacterium]|nr:hypothetical protein [Chlamydiales bacterium]
MDVRIESNPSVAFRTFPSLVTYSIDLNRSIKEKLKAGEQLTNATALKILKQIKWKSDVISFLTKPVFVISLSSGVFLAGMCTLIVAPFIPVAGIVLFAVGLLFGTLGVGMLGDSIKHSLSGFLPFLSQAYGIQSRQASEYIRIIEDADHELQFVLP